MTVPHWGVPARTFQRLAHGEWSWPWAFLGEALGRPRPPAEATPRCSGRSLLRASGKERDPRVLASGRRLLEIVYFSTRGHIILTKAGAAVVNDVDAATSSTGRSPAARLESSLL